MNGTGEKCVHGDACSWNCAQPLPDPDDEPFLECALTAGVPLVTGNIRHFPKSAAQGVQVMTPEQFLASIRG